MDALSIWIGYDPRPAETQGFAVARNSIRRHLTIPIPINGLSLNLLRSIGLYKRETTRKDGRLWDVISENAMSTEFAISRFLVPRLARNGWALFVDADTMARTNLRELFDMRDDSKACMVVKHDYTPKSGFKMDGQLQLAYERKNWSSVVLWNCEHQATKALSLDMVNKERGLWLHQFSWLDDADIGELDASWNHLVGEMEPNPKAKLVHFTIGTPNMDGHEHCEFADEWRDELERWAV